MPRHRRAHRPHVRSFLVLGLVTAALTVAGGCRAAPKTEAPADVQAGSDRGPALDLSTVRASSPDSPQLPFLPPPAPPVPPVPAIAIDLDCSTAPDLQEWGENVRALCVEWYPRLCRELASEGFTPPTRAAIVIDEQMRGVAATSGNRIRASAKFIREHPGDRGMMIHELVHVIQSYPNRPRRAPGWVVEGIADYVRFYIYEPGADRSRIDPERATYRDSYRTTAAFFDYVVRKHDPEVVRKLNASLRAGECDEERATQILGGDPGALWKEFLKERSER